MRTVVLFATFAIWLGAPGVLFADDKPNLFDPRSLPLGIWSLVVFALLLFVLGRYAWRPMLEGLRRREESIKSAIDEAQKTREEAQNLRTQLERQLAQAHEKVREIIDEGRRAAQQMQQEMINKARAENQTERERLRREIETAKDQALHDIWNQTAQLATLISAKAIRRQITEADHRHLVDEALSELHQAGTQWQQTGGGVGL
jgi:F-type H+-transporting ATPase subunit b